MTSTTKVRNEWAAYRCIHACDEPKVQAHIWGRNRGLTPVACVDSWAALEAVLTATGYPKPQRAEVDRRCPRGIDNKPCKESGADCSLHNYGMAIDLDPPENRHFKRRFGDRWDFSDVKITRAQVEAVEGIRTVSGARVFRWLGWDIGDSMHFQIDCFRKDLDSGIDNKTVQEVNVFTPEEETFLKNFVKVVVEDMGSSRAFASSAITDIRKDIITRNELIRFFSDLPVESAEEAIQELLRRLRA